MAILRLSLQFIEAFRKNLNNYPIFEEFHGFWWRWFGFFRISRFSSLRNIFHIRYRRDCVWARAKKKIAPTLDRKSPLFTSVQFFSRLSLPRRTPCQTQRVATKHQNMRRVCCVLWKKSGYSLRKRVRKKLLWSRRVSIPILWYYFSLVLAIIFL